MKAVQASTRSATRDTHAVRSSRRRTRLPESFFDDALQSRLRSFAKQLIPPALSVWIGHLDATRMELLRIGDDEAWERAKSWIDGSHDIDAPGPAPSSLRAVGDSA